MTTYFFAPPSAIEQDTYLTLPEDEAVHAVRVLRKKPGDEILVVDGAGGWYRVRLDRVDKRRAAGTILETRREVGEPAYGLSIGLALLKNRNRYETFLEKAVELGVQEVIPLLTDRTEKTHIKEQRAEKLLLAAMKQCGRSRLVQLADSSPVLDVLEDTSADIRLIAHEQTDPAHNIAAVLARHPSAPTVRILIGPEGGFSDAEVAEAQRVGYTAVSLGSRRLRAETAALVAATAVLLSQS